MFRKENIHKVLLTLIILLAVFLRTYNINNAPSGIYPDEANNGTNSYDAQLNNDYKWFYPDNNGREGLFLNIIALSFKIFGVSILSFKLPSILMGTLTVLGVYFLSTELFIKKRRLALITSYLVAVSFWAINFSRISFRAGMMLPVLVFAFYFLFRAIRENKRYLYILAGIVFGLGFHTYIAFRIAPVLLLVILFFFILSYKNFVKERWTGFLIFGIFAFITIFPMLLTFYQHPEYLNSRTGDVSVFADKENSLVETLFKTVTLSLGKFNFYGDQNWRHGFPPYPTLETITGIAFVFGLLTSIFSFFKLLYLRFKKKVYNKKLITHAFLLACFGAFLAPEFMTTEGLPHALRSIGTLPIVYIFSAYFINGTLDYIEKHFSKIYKVAFIVTIILLVYIGIFESVKYHLFWANSSKQAEAFNKPLTDIAFYTQNLSPEIQKYIFVGPLERLTIKMFNENTKNLTFLYENEVNLIDFKKDFIIMIPNYNEKIVQEIKKSASNLNLQLEIKKKESRLNSFFTIITPEK